MISTVKELKEKLESIDDNTEILIVDDNYEVHGIEDIELEILMPRYLPSEVKRNLCSIVAFNKE